VTGKEKRAGIIGGLVFIGLGIAAIINPNLTEGAEASGRNFLIKLVFIYPWSRPGGVIAILLGCGSIWGVIKPREYEKKEIPAEEIQKPEPSPTSTEEIETASTEENDDKKYAPPGYFDE